MKWLFLVLLLLVAACAPVVEITPEVNISTVEEPEVEEPEVEEVEAEEPAEVEEPEESVVEEPEAEEALPETVQVTLENSNFSPQDLFITKGTYVNFTNKRTQTRSDAVAFLLGEQDCRGIKTKIFKPGESVVLFFNETKENCVIVDGIRITQAMNINIK